MGPTGEIPRDGEPSSGPGPDPGGSSTEPGAEGLADTARRLYAEGEAAARGLLRTLDALQTLAGHEAALARAALPQAVLFAGLAVALGLAAWIFLMALLVVALQIWVGWLAALALAILLSLGGAAACAWRCFVLLKMSRFEATRRQLRRFRRVLKRPETDPDAPAPDASATPDPRPTP